MATSSTLAPSPLMTRSEWVSTLPLWRRCLAMLNWRPVYDIEQQIRQLKLKEIEDERRLKQLEAEDKRLAELESRLDALLLNADSSSQTPPSAGSN